MQLLGHVYQNYDNVMNALARMAWPEDNREDIGLPTAEMIRADPVAWITNLAKMRPYASWKKAARTIGVEEDPEHRQSPVLLARILAAVSNYVHEG